MKTAQFTVIAACLALLGGVAAPAQATTLSTQDGLQLSSGLHASALLLAATGSDRKNDGLDDAADTGEDHHAPLPESLAATGSDRKNDGLDDAPDVDGPDDNGVDA